MSKLQYGASPAGISGHIGQPGTDVDFAVVVYAWSRRTGTLSKDRVGRGTNGDISPRFLRLDSTLALGGKSHLKAPPEPSNWEGQVLPVRLTAGASRYVDFDVAVLSFTADRDVKTNDLWDVQMTARIVGRPTYTGWGEQTELDDPTKFDVQLYDGTTLTKDPKGLAEAGQITIDFWSLTADTDAVVRTRLLAAITAQVVQDSTFKKRPGTIIQDAPDGGTIILTFGLTDTEEDVVNPVTWTKTDPEELGNAGSAAAVNTNPSTPAGLVDRGLTVRELNDQKELRVRELGTRSTKEDREMPGTFDVLDPLNIDSQGMATEVYNSAGSVPAPADPTIGTQLVTTKIEELDRVKSQRTTTFETLNSEQKRTFPQIKTTDDGNNIADLAVRAEFWETGDTPPALPTDVPTNNVKLINFTDLPITPGTDDVPGKNMRVWVYGPRDSADDQILPNYETVADASSLAATAVRAALDGSSISDPAGYTIRTTLTRPITLALGINRTLTVKVYGLRTTAEDITMPGTFAKLDPLAIDSEAKDTDVYTTTSGPGGAPSAPSAELQLIATQTEEINRIVSKREVTFDVLDSRQKRGFPRVQTTDDPEDIDDSAVRYKFFTHGGSAPSAPDDPPTNNVKLVHTEDLRVTPTQDMRVFVYGPKSSRDEAVLPQFYTTSDVDTSLPIEMVAYRAALDGESPVSPGAGYVQRYTLNRPLTDDLGVNRTLSVDVYGLRTQQQDVTMPGTETRPDPEDIESTAQETRLFMTGAQEPDFGDLTIDAPTDTKLIGTEVQQLNQFTWKKALKLGVRTSKEEIEWLQSHDGPEPSAIGSKYIAAVVRANATVSAPAAPAADVVWTDTDIHRITDTKYVHLYHYARFTDAEQIEADESIDGNDPADLDDDYTRTTTTTSATAPTGISAPAAPETNMVVAHIRSRKVGRAKWAHTFRFAWRSSQSKLEAEHSRAATDPRDLDSETLTADVYPTATPPNDPSTPAKLKLVERLDLETANPAYKLRIWKWAKVDSIDRHELPNTLTVTDPENLASEASAANVDGTPSLPGGYVQRETRVSPLTQGTGSDHTLKVTKGGLRSTKDDVEMPGTFTRVDPLGIESDGKKTTVYDTAGTVPTHTAPSGQQIVTSWTQELNRLRSQKVTETGVLNSEQKRTFPKTSTTDDAVNIDDEAIRAQFWTVGSTPPALPTDAPVNNVKLVAFTDFPVTPTRYMRVWLYGPKNSGDKLVLPNYETSVAQPDSLGSTAIRAALNGDSITPPAGFVLRFVKTIPITTGLGTDRTLTVNIYGTRSTTDDEEMPGTEIETDPEDIDSRARQVIVYESSGDPPVPTIDLPTDTKIVTSTVQELDQTLSRVLHKIGVRTTQEEIEWLQSKLTDDAGGLADSEFKVEVTASATPSVLAATDTTNTEIYGKTTHRITDTQYVHVHEFRQLSATNEQVAEHKQLVVDPGAQPLLSDDTDATIDNSETAPTAPAHSGRVCIRTETRRIGKNVFRHQHFYDFRTNVQKLTAERTRETIDQSALGSEAITAAVVLAAAALGSPTNGSYQLIDYSDLTTPNPAYSLRLYRWGLVTNQQRIEYGATHATADPVEQYNRVTSSIVAHTSTAAALADSLSASNKSDQTFVRASVRILTPNKALQTLEFANDDKRYHSASNHTLREQLRGIPRGGFGSPDASILVRVPGPIIGGGVAGFAYGFVWPILAQRTIGRFLWRRRWSVSDPTTKFFLATRGKVCSGATFLGFTGTEVMYVGPAASYTTVVTGARGCVIDYEFATDNFSFFNDGQLPSPGKLFATGGSAFVTHSGFYDAEDFDSVFVANWPATADFSGFTT